MKLVGIALLVTVGMVYAEEEVSREAFDVTRLGREVTPVGKLGTALGVELEAEIEIVRSDWNAKADPDWWVRVRAFGGRKIDPPVRFERSDEWVEENGLEVGKWYRVFGWETGGFGGVPSSPVRRMKRGGTQFGWREQFVVSSVEEILSARGGVAKRPVGESAVGKKILEEVASGEEFEVEIEGAGRLVVGVLKERSKLEPMTFSVSDGVVSVGERLGKAQLKYEMGRFLELSRSVEMEPWVVIVVSESIEWDVLESLLGQVVRASAPFGDRGFRVEIQVK